MKPGDIEVKKTTRIGGVGMARLRYISKVRRRQNDSTPIHPRTLHSSVGWDANGPVVTIVKEK